VVEAAEVTPHPAPSADGLMSTPVAVHLFPSAKVGKIAGRARASEEPFPSPRGLRAAPQAMGRFSLRFILPNSSVDPPFLRFYEP
jgi:hypothetical protein